MFYAYDGLGSVAALSNHQGKLKTRYQYDAFGEVLAGDLSDNPYAFTGQWLDPESNLYHFHFRKYDAEVGVWTAKDPIGVIFDGPNLYKYVHNSPINHVDILGLTTGGGNSAVGEGDEFGSHEGYSERQEGYGESFGDTDSSLTSGLLDTLFVGLAVNWDKFAKYTTSVRLGSRSLLQKTINVLDKHVVFKVIDHFTSMPEPLSPSALSTVGGVVGSTVMAVVWDMLHPTTLGDATLPDWDRNLNGVPDLIEKKDIECE